MPEDPSDRAARRGRVSDLPALDAAAPFQDELRAAAEAALLGGFSVLSLYGAADLDQEEKSPGNPVTAADHASNDAIVDCLSRRFPNDTILSEESPLPGKERSRSRLWIVDPLDGTREFIGRMPEFSVMVGLAVDGVATVGAVFQPDPGVLYLGVADKFAWLSECLSQADSVVAGPLQPLRVPHPRSERLRLVRSRSHPDRLLQAVELQLGDSEVIPCGSVGVKCSLVATGGADLYVHPVPYLNEWDTCAPEAVLRGAGGVVTDCAGDPLTYGKRRPRQTRGILAGSSTAWAHALPLVREAADSLLEGRAL
jgi:3'(2'), 5'-bisphosphate nucleotidase